MILVFASFRAAANVPNSTRHPAFVFHGKDSAGIFFFFPRKCFFVSFFLLVLPLLTLSLSFRRETRAQLSSPIVPHDARVAFRHNTCVSCRPEYGRAHRRHR
jgi:hypothetical protein